MKLFCKYIYYTFKQHKQSECININTMTDAASVLPLQCKDGFC